MPGTDETSWKEGMSVMATPYVSPEQINTIYVQMTLAEAKRVRPRHWIRSGADYKEYHLSRGKPYLVIGAFKSSDKVIFKTTNDITKFMSAAQVRDRVPLVMPHWYSLCPHNLFVVNESRKGYGRMYVSLDEAVKAYVQDPDRILMHR